MGYGIEADIMKLSKALLKNKDGYADDLGTFTKSTRKCAHQLIELVEANKQKGAAETAPIASA
jgi:hypothetical protein